MRSASCPTDSPVRPRASNLPVARSLVYHPVLYYCAVRGSNCDTGYVCTVLRGLCCEADCERCRFCSSSTITLSDRSLRAPLISVPVSRLVKMPSVLFIFCLYDRKNVDFS